MLGSALPPPAPHLEYAREPAVSEQLDRELRALISGCFNSPADAFLRDQRWVREMPLHRYLLRAENGGLVAHAAVHEKLIGVGSGERLVGGMAEVCVLEAERGRGHVRRLLAAAHEGMLERGIHFALLLGDLGVYASSGYTRVEAPIRRLNHENQAVECAPMAKLLVKALTRETWPEGPVDLRGPLF